MEPVSRDGDPCSLLLTDREIANANLAQREEAAADALAVIARVLDTADTTLSDIEREGTLGPAIKRVCNDLADTVHGIAEEIGKHSEEERREFARACLNDARAELELLEGVVSTACTNDSHEEDNWVSTDAGGDAAPQPASSPASGTDDTCNAIRSASRRR